MSLTNKLITGGLWTYITSSMIESEMKRYNAEILEPIDKVSIIMPSYNEEQFIQIAAYSIRNQSIIKEYPEMFELILVDSGSQDRTVDIAKQYMDRIIISPRGKLTARNIATDQAKGNIIVSVDSDTYYPYHYLNTLLEPFNNLNHPPIAGLFGSTFDYSMKYIPGKIFSLGDFLYNKLISRNRLVGRNSAFWKHNFYLVEKFDESVNQFQLWSIFKEEEHVFGNRMSKFGKIIFKPEASCHHLGGTKSFKRLINKGEF